MGKLENVQYTEDMTISSVDVSHLIGHLKCGKVAASDDARCLYMYVIVRMLYICCVSINCICNYVNKFEEKSLFSTSHKNVCAEYFKLVHHKLNALLSLYFTLFFIHIPICLHQGLKQNSSHKTSAEIYLIAITTDQLHLRP